MEGVDGFFLRDFFDKPPSIRLKEQSTGRRSTSRKLYYVKSYVKSKALDGVPRCTCTHAPTTRTHTYAHRRSTTTIFSTATGSWPSVSNRKSELLILPVDFFLFFLDEVFRDRLCVGSALSMANGKWQMAWRGLLEEAHLHTLYSSWSGVWGGWRELSAYRHSVIESPRTHTRTNTDLTLTLTLPNFQTSSLEASRSSRSPRCTSWMPVTVHERRRRSG